MRSRAFLAPKWFYRDFFAVLGCAFNVLVAHNFFGGGGEQRMDDNERLFMR